MKEDLTANLSSRSNFAEGDESRDWLWWQTVSSKKIAECKIFDVKETLAASKVGSSKTGRFYTLNCGPWVNIIAITEQQQLILVRQYRHGIEELTLEIPGGSIDSTDVNPQVAAMRELREETGYVADRWSLLGKNHPNPALQDNVCYTYLAEDARWIEEPKFDGTGTERITIQYANIADIGSLVKDGTITHALVITAFHFLMLYRPELLVQSGVAGPGIQS